MKAITQKKSTPKKISVGIFIILVLVVGSPFFNAYAAIPTIEREALIALYNSTDGDEWSNNSGWKDQPLYSDGFALPGTECNWQGVSCNVQASTIVGLDLLFNNLTGIIPAELGNLAYLQKLYLFLNHLIGNIPAELGNLANLQELRIGFNQLTGSIPAELGNLTSLQRLFLNDNRLVDKIPKELMNLRNLYLLNVCHNHLYTTEPDLRNFLNSIQIGGDWESCQTFPLPRFLTLPLQRQAVVANGWQYGANSDPQRDDTHFAIDYFVDDNTKVISAADGYAMYDCQPSCDNPGNASGYGRLVIIKHGKNDGRANYFFTLYAHLSESISKIPRKSRFDATDELDVNNAGWFRVRRGQIIGKTGRSGNQTWPHLHFTVFTNSYGSLCHPEDNYCEPTYTYDPYDLYKITADEDSSNYYPPKKTETIESFDMTRTRSSGSKYTVLGVNKLWISDPRLPPAMAQPWIPLLLLDNEKFLQNVMERSDLAFTI